MKRGLSILSVIAVLALALSALITTSSGVGLVKALGLTMPNASIVTEAVTKTGVAGTVPGGGVGSQTIDWTIDYDLTSASPLTNMLLTDTWSAGQTLVPGSVHTPGGTWSYNQPDSTSINFTNPLVAPGGKGAGIPVYVGLTGPVSLTGGGDGYNPAITASKKIMGINHHISAAYATIWCYDTVAAGVCSGYPKLPGINTSTNPTVRAIGNKLYIAGADYAANQSVLPGNIYCWDSDTDSLCGTSQDIGGYDRLEVVNGLLYTLLDTGAIDCYDPDNALAECAGYPIQVGVPALTSGTFVDNGLMVVGDSLYALNSTGLLNCLDTSTLGFCSGWSVTPITGTAGSDILFPRLNVAGVITGVCQMAKGTDSTCYDLNGSNPVTVSGTGAATTGTLTAVNDGTYFGSRVWFGGYGNELGCWDWATNAVCVGSGFTDGKVLGLGNPYGLTNDGFCIYSFGDLGKLFSVDPDTGATPCLKSGGETTVDIDDFYSNTTPGTVAANWDKITLTNVNLTPGVDFNSLVIWVTDPGNATVFGPTEMIGGSGIIDISSVSSSIRALTMHIQATLVSSGNGINARAYLTFDSNVPVQFTYQTTINCTGLGQSLSNTINTTLDPHSDTANVTGCGGIVATPTATVTKTLTPTKTITPTSAVTSTSTATATKTATVTVTPTSTPVTVTFDSIAAQDGMVLESSETSGVGGTLNNTAVALTLGDHATKKQYRSIVSFNTSSLPDTATIIKITLKLTKESNGSSGDPVVPFLGFMWDIKTGFFGTTALEITDFEAAASNTYGPELPALVSNVYSINVTPGKSFINKLASNSGLTQIRLRLKLDDNNDAIADYLRLFSGDNATDHPQLVVTYYP